MVAGCALKNFSKERCGIKILRRMLIFTDAIRNSFQIDGVMRHKKRQQQQNVLYPRTLVPTVLTEEFTSHTSQVLCFFIYI